MVRQFAIVPGASTGIGYEFARICAREGFDLLIAADEVEIERAAADLRREPGAEVVEARHLDLAKQEDIDKLHAAIRGRPIDVLTANAGRGLGHPFLDQGLARIRDVIDTNVTGTTCLLHQLGNDMRRRNQGRILIAGSIAGFTPGSFQAVYNASKAYLNSLSFALREELRDSEISVTCLMQSATETEFFKRADMLDTKVGSEDKDDPAMVARQGFVAMVKGEGDVVQSAVANVTPAEMLAKQHRKMAEPGSAKH